MALQHFWAWYSRPQIVIHSVPDSVRYSARLFIRWQRWELGKMPPRHRRPGYCPTISQLFHIILKTWGGDKKKWVYFWMTVKHLRIWFSKPAAGWASWKQTKMRGRSCCQRRPLDRVWMEFPQVFLVPRMSSFYSNLGPTGCGFGVGHVSCKAICNEIQHWSIPTGPWEDVGSQIAR